MGEVVDINSKEVANQVEEVQGEQSSKLSYDNLNELAMQLSNQNRALAQRVQELELDGMFKRLDYLFRVIEVKGTIFPREFVKMAAEEIQVIMTIPQGEVEEEPSTDKPL